MSRILSSAARRSSGGSCASAFFAHAEFGEHLLTHPLHRRLVRFFKKISVALGGAMRWRLRARPRFAAPGSISNESWRAELTRQNRQIGRQNLPRRSHLHRCIHARCRPAFSCENSKQAVRLIQSRRYSLPRVPLRHVARMQARRRSCVTSPKHLSARPYSRRATRLHRRARTHSVRATKEDTCVLPFTAFELAIGGAFRSPLSAYRG